MSLPKDQAAYRVRSFIRKGDLPKKYRRTYEIIDDNTQQIMAFCDVCGDVVFSTLVIVDHQQKSWQMKPTRKIMPSRWIITDPSQNTAMQFDQKVLGKFINPIRKTALVLQDDKGMEVYRIVDGRSSALDRALEWNPEDWAIMSGEKPVAKLGWLPKQSEPPKGFFARLINKIASSDRGIISIGSSHVLSAPVALGMLLLFEALKVTSGD